MSMLLKSKVIRIALLLIVAYSLTWSCGVRNAQSHLASRAEVWLTPLIPNARSEDTSIVLEARARLRDSSRGLGDPILSRGRMDFVFSSTVAILPGVVVASFCPCVDGLCMPESRNVSVVMWYVFGSSALATKIGNRWQMGAA